LNARYAALADAAAAKFGYLALDTARQLRTAGVSQTAIDSLLRLGAARRKERITAWLSAPSRGAMADGEMLAAIEGALTDDWPFRKAESKWAGGEHEVIVRFMGNEYQDQEDRLCGNCSGKSIRVWSSNGKWSGSNSSASLAVTRRVVKAFPSLRTADGSILLDAIPVGPREYRVRWVKQSLGFDLAAVDGWLIRGYHCQASTIEQARRKATDARRKALAATIQRRDRSRRTRRDWSGVFISVDDSYQAGNCKPMTDQFASQVYRTIGATGPCAVRADVVLSLRDDGFVRRALAVAQRHQELTA
jgi:hypothetical protein